jgi:hypothetical protein
VYKPSWKLAKELQEHQRKGASQILSAHGYRLVVSKGKIVLVSSELDAIWFIRRLFAMGWVEVQNRDFFLEHPIEARFFPKISKEEWEQTWPELVRERGEQNLFELLCSALSWSWDAFPQNKNKSLLLEGAQRAAFVSRISLRSAHQVASYWNVRDRCFVSSVEDSELPEWLQELLSEPTPLDEILLNAPKEAFQAILELVSLARQGKVLLTVTALSEEEDSLDGEVLFVVKPEEALEGAFLDAVELCGSIYQELESASLEPVGWMQELILGLEEESKALLSQPLFFLDPYHGILLMKSDGGVALKEILKALYRLYSRALKTRIMSHSRERLSKKIHSWKEQWEL